MTSHSNARSPFPWFGGKQRMADSIIELMPAHDVYVEVFGGGASVLLSKRPSKLDVYNDANDGLVNFFRVLRDRADELVPLLELTPFARSEYLAAIDGWRDPDVSDVERARRWFTAVSQAYGGHVFDPADRHGTMRGWGGERRGRMHLARCASTANKVDHIWRFVERMRKVQVDNLDWRACLENYDGEQTLFYLDPPYVHGTRRSGRYSYELTDADHEELVARVLELRGNAVVSGYDHPIYAPLELCGFARHDFTVTAMCGVRGRVAEERDRRHEVVWAPPRTQLELV